MKNRDFGLGLRSSKFLSLVQRKKYVRAAARNVPNNGTPIPKSKTNL